MKKLSLILLFGALLFIVPKVQAQRSLISANVNALIKTVDTVTNTGVINMTLPTVQKVVGQYRTVTISTVVTKISGTGAGTIVLQGSTDGVNYETVAASQLQGAQTASYTITNVASQVHLFVVEKAPYLFYRTQTTGSGTEVVSVKGTVYPN